MALNLEGRVEISVGELRGGRQSRERKRHRREDPEVWQGWWVDSKGAQVQCEMGEVDRPRGKIIGGPVGHDRV